LDQTIDMLFETIELDSHIKEVVIEKLRMEDLQIEYLKGEYKLYKTKSKEEYNTKEILKQIKYLQNEVINILVKYQKENIKENKNEDLNIDNLFKYRYIIDLIRRKNRIKNWLTRYEDSRLKAFQAQNYYIAALKHILQRVPLMKISQVIVFNSKSAILLTQQIYPKKVYYQHYRPPGEKQITYLESFKQIAKRETFKETEIEIPLSKLTEDLQYRVYLKSKYEFKYLDPVIKQQFKEIEITKIYQHNIDFVKQASAIQEAINYIKLVKPLP
ncbi:20218_t:CDS:2, partial [Racocetra persica]